MQIAKSVDIDQEINEIEECKEIINTFDPNHSKELLEEVKNETFTLDSLFSTNSMFSMDDSSQSESCLNENSQMILTNHTNHYSKNEVNL